MGEKKSTTIVLIIAILLILFGMVMMCAPVQAGYIVFLVGLMVIGYLVLTGRLKLY